MLPCDVLRTDGEEDMRGFNFQLQPFNSFVLSQKFSGNPCQQISAIPSQTGIIICHIELFQALLYEHTAWNKESISQTQSPVLSKTN